MSEYTDELLDGISDPVTNDIDLFLANSNLDKSQKIHFIQLINAAFAEGYNKRGHHKFWDMSLENDEFMKDFINKLNGKPSGDN
jgi:predicted peptidase